MRQLRPTLGTLLLAYQQGRIHVHLFSKLLDDRPWGFWVFEQPVSRLDDSDDTGGVLIIVVFKPIAVFAELVAVVFPTFMNPITRLS